VNREQPSRRGDEALLQDQRLVLIDRPGERGDLLQQPVAEGPPNLLAIRGVVEVPDMLVDTGSASTLDREPTDRRP
jgi:hypothetical protein